jgi:hypothetical protein
MASHAIPAGTSILDIPPNAYIVDRQRNGENLVLDSWHDTPEEAQAQVEFLTLDRTVAASIIPPARAIRK